MHQRVLFILTAMGFRNNQAKGDFDMSEAEAQLSLEKMLMLADVLVENVCIYIPGLKFCSCSI